MIGIKDCEESAPAAAALPLADYVGPDQYQKAIELAYCMQISSWSASGEGAVPRTFKIGDHVTWNSEAGYVSGTIVAIHTRNVTWKGYVHHATTDEPQYEIKSDKSDHIALHKGAALARHKG